MCPSSQVAWVPNDLVYSVFTHLTRLSHLSIRRCTEPTSAINLSENSEEPDFDLSPTKNLLKGVPKDLILHPTYDDQTDNKKITYPQKK